MEKLKKLIVILKKYLDAKWYGKLEISIEEGDIVNVKIIHNVKL